MSDIYEVMRTARAIRRFRDEPVPDEVLRRCLEAATWAPSGGNRQPWRFVVLQSPACRAAMRVEAIECLRVIEELYGYSRPDADDDSADARARRAVYELHDHAAEVPAAVLFTFRQLPATPAALQGSAVFAAMQNFLLACRAEGLGAVVNGWASTSRGEVRAVVGVPEGWEIGALVAVGWPRGRHGPVRRRPVEAVTYLDRWDEPFGGQA